MKHYWYAPALPNYAIERTYTFASFGDLPFSGTGLYVQADQDALAAEGHWDGYRGNNSSGAARTPVMTVTRAGSPRATAAPNAPPPAVAITAAGASQRRDRSAIPVRRRKTTSSFGVGVAAMAA
jgi:hypothetical protein